RLLELDISYRRHHSDTLSVDDYRRRFPAYGELIQAIFVAEGVHSENGSEGPGGAELLRCPPVDPESQRPPEHLGRYRITAQLGQGAFGVVYKAYDEALQRDVAIKVPHRHRIASPKDAEAYLTEARILARLSHPGIVPAYDLGRTEDGLCYLVPKFVEGC